MQYKLLGWRESQFNGTDGNPVHGISLYLGQQIQDHGQGYYCFQQFVFRDRCPELKLGDFYECSYRRGSGKLERIEKVQ